MSAFLVQHIDAILSTGAGLLFTSTGFKAASRGDTSGRTRLLKILGPCVIVFGLFRFFMGSLSPADWQRVASSDGLVSVEFPGRPKPNEQTQTQMGQAVQTSGWIYDVRGRDISLRLSCSEAPPAEANVSSTVKFAFLKKMLAGQDCRILSEGTGKYGGLPGYSLTLEKLDGTKVIYLRIMYIGNRIYRALATADKSLYNDPLIPRFMESFQAGPGAGK